MEGSPNNAYQNGKRTYKTLSIPYRKEDFSKGLEEANIQMEANTKWNELDQEKIRNKEFDMSPKKHISSTKQIEAILNGTLTPIFTVVDYNTPEKKAELIQLLQAKKDVLKRKELRKNIDRRAHDFTQH